MELVAVEEPPKLRMALGVEPVIKPAYVVVLPQAITLAAPSTTTLPVTVTPSKRSTPRAL